MQVAPNNRTYITYDYFIYLYIYLQNWTRNYLSKNAINKSGGPIAGHAERLYLCIYALRPFNYD